MHIRTFRAANLQAALAEIRQQMGPDAAVLHTRQVRDGWRGLLGRTQVEVTAGLRSPQTAVVRERVTSATSSHEREGNYLREQLLRVGVSDAYALRWTRRVLERLPDRQSGQSFVVSSAMMLDALQTVVAEEVRCGPAIQLPANQRRVIALIGPTGVGKTTTVAKLSAGFRLQQKRKVGLLTIDTFRIAAVEQLRSYAEIMDLPMQVVQKPDQMQAALDALSDVDLVLIDTAGRSPRLGAAIRQLRAMLGVARPDEIHLVVSGTSSSHATQRIMQGFGEIKPTSLILTKLDETEQVAGVIATLMENQAPPVSYLTTGQQVPDDILVASGQVLAQYLLPKQAAIPLVA